jgi:hypothetical protein
MNWTPTDNIKSLLKTALLDGKKPRWLAALRNGGMGVKFDGIRITAKRMTLLYGMDGAVMHLDLPYDWLHNVQTGGDLTITGDGMQGRVEFKIL